jgi:hypothetical protein
MARIYKRTDRISVKIDDIVVKLAPLTISQKTEIQQAMLEGSKKTDIREATRGIALAIQYSVKGIEGVQDSDGNPYALQFEGGNLTEACVDDLMNLELTRKLTLVCVAMVKGVPSKFTDEQDKDLEGVELVNPSKGEPTKNA